MSEIRTATISPALSRPLLALLIILACLASTGPILRNHFINWDDHEQITENADFNPVRLKRMITYWGGPYVGSLYPVSYDVFGVLSAIGRVPASPDGATISPIPFHVASIVLHVLCCLLVWAILRLLIHSEPACCAGAILFAVHPVQVEPVAWVSGMNTLLFAVLSLLAIWQYLLSVRPGVPRGGRWILMVSATIAFILALWSKPTAVVVPVLAGLLDWLLTRRRVWDIAKPMIVWIVLSIPIMWITRRLQTGELVTPTPLWTRPFVAGDAITFYLRQIAFPWRLLVDYGHTPQWVREHPLTWLELLVPILLAIVCWRLRKRTPWLIVALAFFIVALLPVLGLTPFDVQMISTVTDRYLYLAMFAPAMVLAFGLARANWRGLCAIVAVALVLLGVRSNLRARQWHDEFSLFLPELKINPRSLAAHQVLGVTYSATGRKDLAAEHLEAALRTKPDDPRSLYNLGNILLGRGDFTGAARLYERALVKFPSNPRIHNNLAVALARSGYFDAAEDEFHRALSLQPDMPEAAKGLKVLAKLRASAATSQPGP